MGRSDRGSDCVVLEQPIGTVTDIRGQVVAVDKNGHSRLLNMGEPLYLYDNIMVSDQAYIDIELKDGRALFFGRNTSKVLDCQLVNEAAHTFKP